MNARLDFYAAGPEAVRAMMAMEKRIRASGLDSTLVDLARLRASQINGCAYCVDLHTADLRKAGVSERSIATVCVWPESPFFSDRERAALTWTEALTSISADRVPDAVWNGVRPFFNDQELVDLSLVVVAINSWNRFAIAFRKSPS